MKLLFIKYKNNMSIYDELLNEIENEPMEFLDEVEISAKKIENIIVDEKNNIKKNLNTIKLGPSIEINELFTPLISTTATISGQINELVFVEKELVKKIIPRDNILLVGCNFEERYNKHYDKLVAAIKKDEPQKTNRGRKKKIKNRSAGHIQGNGKYFNCQLTFLIAEGGTIYQFKLFRTGSIQLPGARLNKLDEVVKCINKIIEVLKAATKNNNIYLDSLVPSMKNYKFKIMMGENDFLDLATFKNTIDALKSPFIKDVKYTSEDIKLCIQFFTPTARKSTKCVRVNLFTSGKINILGAYDDDMTAKIYDFLLNFVKRHKKTIIIGKKDTADDDYVALDYLDNIINQRTICADEYLAAEKIYKNILGAGL